MASFCQTLHLDQDWFKVSEGALPGYLSTEAKALVRALLEKDPAKRLGSGPGGNAAVKAHPFFRSINWELLHSRKVGAQRRGTP